MICFTVMDFDMMTTNDFEGEAFLRVTQVAGVDGTGNILNVTPMELPLLQPKEKSKFCFAPRVSSELTRPLTLIV